MDPAFDREGDYLYFTSGRTFRPEYSPVDGTFIYTEPGNLYAMPLRNDMDPVWTVEFDEVEWEEEKEEEPADEGAEETDDEQGEAEGDEAPADQPTEGDDAPKDDEKASWR